MTGQALGGQRVDRQLLLPVALGFFLLAWATTELTAQGDSVAVLRIAGAAFLAFLLRRRPAGRWLAAYFTVAAVAWIASSIAAGRSPAVSVGFGLSRVAELVTAFALIRTRDLERARSEPAEMGAIVLLAAGLAPVVGMAGAALTVSLTHGGALLPTLSNWWLANVVGTVLVLPAALQWNPGTPGALRNRAGVAETVALVAGGTVAALLALRFSSNAFVVISLVPLLAAFRLSMVGTAVSALLVAVSVMAIRRIAPSWAGLLEGDGTAFELADLMFYTLCATAPGLVIAYVEQARVALDSRAAALGRRLEAIADNMPAALWHMGGDGRRLYSNRLASQWWPATSGDAGPPGPAASQADGADCAQAFDVRAGGRDLEVYYVAADRNSPTEGLLGMALDVTERRRMESALHEAGVRAQVTLAALSDAVITCDTGLRVTSLNPAAQRMTGWRAEAAVGASVSLILPLQDREGESCDLLGAALASGRAVTLAQDHCLRARNGGKAYLVRGSASPLTDRSGRVIGVVATLQDVSDARVLSERIAYLAGHDPVTGLPNRTLLLERVDDYLRSARSDAAALLIHVGLADLAGVNQTLGQAAGDSLLAQASGRVQQALGAEAFLSREAGAEFVALVPSLRSGLDPAALAQLLLAQLVEPFMLGEEGFHAGAAIGIAVLPRDAADADTALSRAALAFSSARARGPGHVEFFTDELLHHAERRARLERDLHRAIERGELSVVFQPKIDLRRKVICGAEALVRWTRNGESISPAEFIPIAESCGVVADIDAWVMARACEVSRAWLDAGDGALPVSVNVSLATFNPDRLLDVVEAALGSSGLPPHLLEIEFTETQTFARMEGAQALIARLKARGVRVAMDDFGTGYSSFGYLTRYRFDTLKIDQSFVRALDTNDQHVHVLAALINMARALDYHVVAEGVETAAQETILRRLGCHEVQGYLYSVPVPAANLRQQWLAA